VSRHILNWILEDRYASPGERHIIAFLEYLAQLMALWQACILLGGSFVLFPNLAKANLDDKSDPHYCDRGLVTFSAIFLSVCWFFVALAFICWIYVRCTSGDVRADIKQALMADYLDRFYGREYNTR